MLLRDTPDGKRLKERWWLFSRSRPELSCQLREQKTALVISQVTARFGFAILPATTVFSHKLCIFPNGTFDFFACVQSRVHECWARFFSATLKDDLSYSPADCFDTFPLASDLFANAELYANGDYYYNYRAALMVESNEGLTKTYNRFNDPYERSPGILKLRELHDAMDRAVLEAYGWDDLAATARCEFLLDYEEEGTGDSGLGVGDLGDENQLLSASPKSRRKLPWRLRWPDDFRDEVLARLLELNEQRHKQELLAGSSQLSAKKETKATKKTAKSTKATPGQALPGFDDVDG
jgi:hypothetical protein